MYICLCDNGAVTGKTIKEVNKKMNGLMEEIEFVPLGNDKVSYLTKQDIEFVQDKKRLSAIPIKNLYKKENTSFIISVITLAIAFIIMVKG